MVEDVLPAVYGPLMRSTLNTTLLVIHILAVAVWFGGILALSFASTTLAGADASARRWFADAQLAVGRVAFSVAAVLTLVTGVWLTLDQSISMGSTFVTIGFAVVIVGTVLGMAVYAPACKQLITAIDAGDKSAEEAASKKLMTTNAVNAILLLIAVVSMVATWGLKLSL